MINKPELPISRIKAMLDYLNKIEDKLEIVLNILRNVYPWNNPVRSLAVEYSHYEHYLSDAISYYLQYEDILDHLQTFGEEIDFSDENDVIYMQINNFSLLNKVNDFVVAQIRNKQTFTFESPG